MIIGKFLMRNEKLFLFKKQFPWKKISKNVKRVALLEIHIYLNRDILI